jgi:hypothetical protein
MDRTPQGNEILDFEPAHLPQEHLAAIGLMSAAASSTDSVIEMAIAGMLGIDGEQGYAVTAHMSGPLRASVLRSAAEIIIENPKLLDVLDDIMDAIKDATNARNDIVHGSWCVRPSDGTVFLVQQEARTHVVITSRPVTVDEIKLKALTLYGVGMDLMRFITMLGLVPALPRADRKRGVNTPRRARLRVRKRESSSTGLSRLIG